MASIEKRGDSYRIKVSCGYDVNGKKIVSSITYHPEYFTSTGKKKAASVIQKELEQFVAEFERSVRLGDTLAGSSMRVSDLIEKYLKEYAFVELSAATAEGYETALKKKILPKFGHYKVSDLCRKQLEIQAFYNDMAKPDDDGKRLAQSTVKRNMNVFSSIVEAVGSNPICSMLETLDFSRVFLFISVEDFKYFLLFGYYLGTTQYISRAVRSVALVQVSLNRRAPVPFMPSLRTRSSYRNGRSRLLLDGFRSSRRAVF